MSDASSATSAIAATAASSSTSSSGITNSATKQAAIAKDMQDLAAALKKHDEKAAKKALLQLAMDSTAGSSSNSSAGNNLIGKLASALNSGDVAKAQQVFSSFQADAAAAFQAQGSPDPSTPSLASAKSTETNLFNGQSSPSRFSVTV